MKSIWTLVIILIAVVSCNDETERQQASTVNEADSTETFFPVTNYLKGQIAQLKQSGINPMRITSVNKKVDTVWLKIEQLDSVFVEFLQPEIDSNNLTGYFKETKFADQTLNNYTFTYEPSSALPETIMLQKWDIYINPETNTVKRIYMVKKNKQNQLMQLTWQADNFSKIVYLNSDGNGNEFVEKEVLVKWKFD